VLDWSTTRQMRRAHAEDAIMLNPLDAQHLAI